MSVSTDGFTQAPSHVAYVDVNGDDKSDFCQQLGAPDSVYILCTTNLEQGGADVSLQF